MEFRRVLFRSPPPCRSPRVDRAGRPAGLGCPPGSEPGSERARSDGGSADDLSEVVSGERLGQQELSACADRLLTHIGGGCGSDEPEVSEERRVGHVFYSSVSCW